MIGAIDVGGGTRGIYGAGVFDYCLDQGIHFDYICGVSAGSANAASFIAGQRGRNYRFYIDYAFRKDYMSLSNFLRTGSYLGLEYIYGTISNAGMEDPFDAEAFNASPVAFEAVATDAETGKPVYFGKEGMQQDNYYAMKSSCCVPVINKPYEVDGHYYFDGGIVDPIPFRRALEQGCDKLVVILTKPKDMIREQGFDRDMAALLKRKYPETARAMALRFRTYNTQLRLLSALERKGKAVIIAPDDVSGLKTLTKDKEQLDTLYQKAYKDAEAISAFLS